MKKHNISNLLNPSKYQNGLNTKNFQENFLKKKLQLMILIRLTEEKLALERKNGAIGGPVHLGAGQEAIAVGVSANLNKKDMIFGAHRSHSHLLSVNPNPYKLFAEVLGKDTGFSKGMGGSMHLIDKTNGFFGSVPIVSGTVPIAVGAALHAKRKNKKQISVVYLGDGALEEGVVHESLNLSRILSVPILFVVENNLFSSHMHLSLRQPQNSACRFAEANNIPNILVDGNDVIEVHEATKKLLKESRKNATPCFLEAVTFRHYGHVDWRKDIDVGVNRSVKDLKNWMKRDPIERLIKAMIKKKYIDEKKISNIKKKIESRIEEDWIKALKDPFPAKKELLKRVYFED
jgi:pyruvate dehydrogenase E1 component alpha subunit